MKTKQARKMIGVRIEKELEKKLDDVSKRFDRTRSEIIRKVLKENLPRVIKSKPTQKKKSQGKRPSFWDTKDWF